MERSYCMQCMKPTGGTAMCPHCGYVYEGGRQAHVLAPGTILSSKYLLGNVIGQGGFGITYIARDLNLDIRVAVKEYYPNGYAVRNASTSDRVTITNERVRGAVAQGKERFLREARTLAQFRGTPGIVDVLNYFEANNTAYLVMEYLEGEDLGRRLRRQRFTADEIFGLMEPVFDTLEKIHQQGVIHRDISPDNIMLQPDGSLKLMDFGAARFVDFNDGKSKSVVLKAGYAPKEQYSSQGVQGPWTDIYALCATIYKCITGETPVDALDRVDRDNLKWPSQLGYAISTGQEALLKKGMAVERRNRFQSMGELKAALAEKTEGVTDLNEDLWPPEDGAGSGKDSPGGGGHKQDKAAGKKIPAYFIASCGVLALGVTALVLALALGRKRPPAPAAAETATKTAAQEYSESPVAPEAAALSAAQSTPTPEPENTSTPEPKEEAPLPAVYIKNVIAGSRHAIALQSNGTLFAVGWNDDYQREVNGWSGIEKMAAGYRHTVALIRDGKVVACGSNDEGQCNVSKWSDIVDVSAGFFHTVAVNADGYVFATGSNSNKQCDVSGWSDIVNVSAGGWHTAGLKADGTAVATGLNSNKQCAVSGWRNISQIAAGGFHTVGLKTDGTVVATGANINGQCNVSGWSDIIAIAAGAYHTVGLRQDGTVVAVGQNESGQCNVRGWKDIIAIATGDNFTIGLKKDGSIVSVGDNEFGQLNLD